MGLATSANDTSVASRFEGVRFGCEPVGSGWGRTGGLLVCACSRLTLVQRLSVRLLPFGVLGLDAAT